FVVALIILLVGWIVAKIIGNLVENGLKKTNLDEKMASKFQTGDKPLNSGKIIGKTVYYIILVIAFMLFFERLNFNVLANPLSNVVSSIFDLVPALLKAAIIFAIAWIVATLVRWLIVRGTDKAKIQQLFFKIKLADTQEEVKKFMQTLGQVAFYLILLMVIPGILDALNISGVSQPFSSLLSNILIFIPKLLAAALVFVVGWFVAKIIKGIVVNLLEAVGSERLIARLRLQSLFEGTSFA